MNNNDDVATIFNDIRERFFNAHNAFMVRFYDSAGIPKLGIETKNMMPTYLVYGLEGEIVFADSKGKVMDDGKEDKSRTTKIGILYKPDSISDLRVNWLITQEKGVVRPTANNYDTLRDLKVIALKLGINAYDFQNGAKFSSSL